MGDWQFGKHYAPPFRTVEAAAASAAPYALGALSLTLPRDGWFEEDPATKDTTTKASWWTTWQKPCGMHTLSRKADLGVSCDRDFSDLRIKVIDLLNNRVEGDTGRSTPWWC